MAKSAKTRFALLFLGVLLLWYFFPTFVTWRIPAGDANEWQHRGTFGDSYGVFTSLFSALAFVGVAMTLHLQGRQLGQIEAREKDAADAQALQIRLMAATALLGTYNLEGNRLQEKMDRLKEHFGWPQVLEIDDYRTTLNKARINRNKQNKIMADLEVALKTGLGAEALATDEAE